MAPKTARALLTLLIAAVVAVVAYDVVTQEYRDPAREQIEREAARQKP